MRRALSTAAAWRFNVPRIEVTMGPMASGKTNALLTRLEECRSSFTRVVAIKHAVDTRHTGVIAARTGLQLPATHTLTDFSSLLATPIADDTLFAIDELQFFDGTVVAFCERVLATSNSSVFVSGLDLDYRAQPFGHTCELAEFALGRRGTSAIVRRLAAMCTHASSAGGMCNKPAMFSQRLRHGDANSSSNVVLVGGEESYRPACELHHIVHPVSLEAWTTPV